MSVPNLSLENTEPASGATETGSSEQPTHTA